MQEIKVILAQVVERVLKETQASQVLKVIQAQ